MSMGECSLGLEDVPSPTLSYALHSISLILFLQMVHHPPLHHLYLLVSLASRHRKLLLCMSYSSRYLLHSPRCTIAFLPYLSRLLHLLSEPCFRPLTIIHLSTRSRTILLVLNIPIRSCKIPSPMIHDDSIHLVLEFSHFSQ